MRRIARLCLFLHLVRLVSPREQFLRELSRRRHIVLCEQLLERGRRLLVALLMVGIRVQSSAREQNTDESTKESVLRICVEVETFCRFLLVQAPLVEADAPSTASDGCFQRLVEMRLMCDSRRPQGISAQQRHALGT